MHFACIKCFSLCLQEWASIGLGTMCLWRVGWGSGWSSTWSTRCMWRWPLSSWEPPGDSVESLTTTLMVRVTTCMFTTVCCSFPRCLVSLSYVWLAVCVNDHRWFHHDGWSRFFIRCQFWQLVENSGPAQRGSVIQTFLLREISSPLSFFSLVFGSFS